MALRKTVAAETADLLVDLLRILCVVATRQHSREQPLMEWLQSAVALPCGHRAPQPVGLARTEARGDHCELHHLLLEDRHAERAFQHRLHCRARVADRLQPITPAQIGMHHASLDRPRPHDRDFDHQVVNNNAA